MSSRQVRRGGERYVDEEENNRTNDRAIFIEDVLNASPLSVRYKNFSSEAADLSG
jgi:hypothetical protein